MPKVKTHHWAGVTLSMKNLFGVVPGIAYGWPKNVLHWKGIDRSILDINAAVPAHFVIADGIVGMEGNGPLHGAPRTLGRIVLADDPVAADFTCARLMGLNPLRVAHLAQAAEFLGNGAPERIIQLAEQLPHSVRPFEVLPEFAYLTPSMKIRECLPSLLMKAAFRRNAVAALESSLRIQNQRVSVNRLPAAKVRGGPIPRR